MTQGSSPPKAGCINARSRLRNLPQGLKPRCFCAFVGTAEAVPFQNRIYATGSGVCSMEWRAADEQLAEEKRP
jgi:hypothetical protein